MPNPHGTPIWYELMTPDPQGAKAFYEAAAGWTIADPPPGPMDYRMIQRPDGGNTGGMLKMDTDMLAAGARPMWVPYFGVDDVDAAFEKAKGLGAAVFVPPTDIPNVGRFAFLADPQGAPFYIMRGAGPDSSDVFERGAQGRCGWNELTTTDAQAALAFYGPLLGFENRESMDMGPMGSYRFLNVGDLLIGALAEMKDRPPLWNLYFTVPDVHAAKAAAEANGGTVDMGPHEVPGGDTIILGSDPQGARFALVSPPKT